MLGSPYPELLTPSFSLFGCCGDIVVAEDAADEM